MCQTPDEVFDCPLCLNVICSPSMNLTSPLPQHSCLPWVWPLLCNTVSSFVFSNLFWHTLSLALSFCPPPPHLAGLFSPGAPEGYKCSSASPQYELIPNLAARRSERKIDTKTHHLQKQVEECRTKYSYRKNIYKEDVTGSKHRVALFCWNKTLLIRTFPNPWTTL